MTHWNLELYIQLNFKKELDKYPKMSGIWYTYDTLQSMNMFIKPDDKEKVLKLLSAELNNRPHDDKIVTIGAFIVRTYEEDAAEIENAFNKICASLKCEAPITLNTEYFVKIDSTTARTYKYYAIPVCIIQSPKTYLDYTSQLVDTNNINDINDLI